MLVVGHAVFIIDWNPVPLIIIPYRFYSDISGDVLDGVQAQIHKGGLARACRLIFLRRAPGREGINIINPSGRGRFAPSG